VDAAVTEAMADALPSWGRHATANRAGHWLLDIAGINRALLEAAGLCPDRIEDVELCTSCRNDLFFSHRAEKGRTGRMMNFILVEEEEDRQGQR
jgi:copper oxidase (laccase) domain-containing protein